jgi:hypothetical protein
VREALRHWRCVRELVADPEPSQSDEVALAVEACSQILSLGWRLGESEHECERVFEQGRALAEQANDLGSLAHLLANYSGVRGLNPGNSRDYTRYADEATRVADRTGDAELRCGARGYLVAAHMCTGQTGLCMAAGAEIEDLAAGDVHLGVRITGFSPLLFARMMKHRALGYGGDSERYLSDLPAQRQVFLDLGYPEMAYWTLADEAWIACALGRGDGARARATEAVRRAENQDLMSAVAARMALGYALAHEGDWVVLLEQSQSLLHSIQEARVAGHDKPQVLDLLALAQFGLGQLREARATAVEAMVFAESNETYMHPRHYETLARVQLALDEPAAAVEATLGAYEKLIERTRFRMLEGGLHEQRATLAERAGEEAARTAALERARETYAACAMLPDAERMAEMLSE